MINQLLSFVSIISIYEFIKYVDLIQIIRSNLEIYKKIILLFKLKKTSDFREEKLILDYSKSLFISSIKIVVIIGVVLIFIFLLDKITFSFVSFITSIYGSIEISFLFIIYHLVRKRINAKL